MDYISLPGDKYFYSSKSFIAVFYFFTPLLRLFINYIKP